MRGETFGDSIRKAREAKNLPFSEILQPDLKEVQTNFTTDKINNNFGRLEHLTEGFKVTEN